MWLKKYSFAPKMKQSSYETKLWFLFFCNLKMEKQPCVYIMASKRNGTLYVGVTSNLIKRIYQHKYVEGIGGFAKKYDCIYLVYFELCGDMLTAITREKQIKAGSRKKKLELIEKTNSEWKDLYESLV